MKLIARIETMTPDRLIASLESAIEYDRDEDAEILRQAAIDRDAPREWTCYQDGQECGTVVAGTRGDALELAASDVDRSYWPDAEGTIWIDVEVRCDLTGECDTDTVALDEDAPDCTETEHVWCSPHVLLGGIAENPGCWGHGGGVVIREVCRHCLVTRITDTWAHRPDTGEQGLTSVSYDDEWQHVVVTAEDARSVACAEGVDTWLEAHGLDDSAVISGQELFAALTDDERRAYGWEILVAADSGRARSRRAA